MPKPLELPFDFWVSRLRLSELAQWLWSLASQVCGACIAVLCFVWSAAALSVELQPARFTSESKAQ